MDGEIKTIFEAFDACFQARAAAELAMFRSAADLRAPRDDSLFERMRLERRREVFCVRSLLYLSEEASERASALRRRLPARPPLP